MQGGLGLLHQGKGTLFYVGIGQHGGTPPCSMAAAFWPPSYFKTSIPHKGKTCTFFAFSLDNIDIRLYTERENMYQAYTDYHGMMDLTENLYRHVAQEVTGGLQLPYGEHVIDLSKPFECITMVDAVKKYANVDFNEIKDLEEARAVAREHHIEFEERHKKGDILNLFFEEYVEEHLIQPTFVMDHPIEISPLTKKKPDNPEYVERFEFFINGWEMANAYSELNDPIDQRERFKAQEELLAQGDDEANTTDEDFMNALELGMPPTGGIGFGIDRMVMIMTNSAAIRDVLLFPTMKSLDK